MAEGEWERPLGFPAPLVINWHLYPVYECEALFAALRRCHAQNAPCQRELTRFLDCYLTAHNYPPLSPLHAAELRVEETAWPGREGPSQPTRPLQ